MIDSSHVRRVILAKTSVYIRPLLKRLSAAVFTCIIGGPINHLAISDEQKKQPVIVLSPLQTLQQYIDHGQIPEAHRVLEAMTLALQDPAAAQQISGEDWIELEFLRGRLAMLEGHPASAALIFETILVRYPDVVRVRLELGLALYTMQEDQRALYHFDLALQAHLPTEAEARVETIKGIMRQRRNWQVRVKIALVPDTNINAATDDRTVELFGLPFSLNDAARERSGIGGLAEVNILNSHRLGGKTSLMSDLSLRHTEYDGSRFDDTILAAYSGPERAIKYGIISMRVGGFRRWFGQGAFNWGAGVQARVFRRFNPNWSGGLNTGLSWVGYDQNQARDGLSVQIEPYVNRSIGTSGRLRIRFTFSEDFAREKNQANVTYRYGVGFQRELPRHLLLDLHAAVGTRRFKAVQFPFGVRRKDDFYSAGATLTLREVRILGSALSVSYRYENSDSSVPLFSYARHRVEVGLTKEF